MEIIRFYQQTVSVACLESISFQVGPCSWSEEEILLKLANLIDLSRLQSLDMRVYSNLALLARAAPILQVWNDSSSP
jgi:hypothetical protein